MSEMEGVKFLAKDGVVMMSLTMIATCAIFEPKLFHFSFHLTSSQNRKNWFQSALR